MATKQLDKLWKAERYRVTALQPLPHRVRGIANAGTPHEETIIDRTVPPLFDRLEPFVPVEFSRAELIELVGGERNLGRVLMDPRLLVEPLSSRRGKKPTLGESWDEEKQAIAERSHKMRSGGKPWRTVESETTGVSLTRKRILEYWKIAGLDPPG